MDRLRGGGRLNAQSRSKTSWRRLAAWLGVLALLIGAGYFVFRSFAGGQLPGPTQLYLSALLVAALASGGPNSELSAILIFAATMAALMRIVSALVGRSRETIIHRLKAQTPRIQRASSYLLILVGAFNILSSFYLSQFQTLLFPA